MTDYDDADRRVDPSAPSWPPKLAPRGEWATLDDLGLPPPSDRRPGGADLAPPGAGGAGGGSGYDPPPPMASRAVQAEAARPPVGAPAPGPSPFAPPTGPAAPPAAPPPGAPLGAAPPGAAADGGVAPSGASPFGNQLNAWGSASARTEATVSRPPVVATPDDLLSSVRPPAASTPSARDAAAAPAPPEVTPAAHLPGNGLAPGAPADPVPAWPPLVADRPTTEGPGASNGRGTAGAGPTSSDAWPFQGGGLPTAEAPSLHQAPGPNAAGFPPPASPWAPQPARSEAPGWGAPAPGGDAWPQAGNGAGAADQAMAYGAAAPGLAPPPPAPPGRSEAYAPPADAYAGYGQGPAGRYGAGPGGPGGQPPYDPGPGQPRPSAPPRPAGATAYTFRPGAGLVIALVGLAALALSFLALPWADFGGEEATFADIRRAVDEQVVLAPALNVAPGESAASAQQPLPPDPMAQDPSLTTTTLPFNTVSPTLPDGSPAVTPPSSTDVGVTPTVGSSGSDEFRSDYIEAFAQVGWIAILAWAAVAALFSTLFVPSGYGGRAATGFLVAGLVGLLVNLADRNGSVGPRLTGAIASLAAGGAFGVGVWALFAADFAPDMASGVYVGGAGLALVFVGCLVGTRRRPAAA